MANKDEPGTAPEMIAGLPHESVSLDGVVEPRALLPTPELARSVADPTAPARHGSGTPVSPLAVALQAPPAGTERAEDDLPTFPIIIPDFINWDSKVVAPEPVPDDRDRRGRKKRAPFFARRLCRKKRAPFFARRLWWPFGWMALVAQRRNPVTIPAQALGAAIWGADRATWPRNWLRVVLGKPAPRHAPELTRPEKARRTRELRAAVNAKRRACPADCPLHGGPRHLHVTWTFSDSGLGRVKLLQCGKNPDGSARFDLTNKYTKDEAEKLQKKINSDIAEARAFKRVLSAEGEYDRVAENERDTRKMQQQLRRAREGGRKVEGLRPIYLPAWVLATSPLVGLTPTQQNLFVALALELTRETRRNGRPDQAAVITGGEDTCPLLDPLTSYTGFNGNGAGSRARLRGHGYKPATWMKKAAYPAGALVGDLVGDLTALAGLFGLVVAAYRPADGAWLNLDELKTESRTADGRNRFAGCLVRVYTAADYLTRWRALFAQKLGFSRIPENPGDLPGAGPVVVPESPAAITTARQLAAWMRKGGLTDAKLAERLGVSRPCVAQYRTGARKIGKAFLAKLASYTGHSESGGCNTPVTPCGAGVTNSSPGVAAPVCENATIPGA